MSTIRYKRREGRSFTYRQKKGAWRKKLIVAAAVIAALALLGSVWWLTGGREAVFSLRSDPLRDVVTGGLVPMTDAPTDVPTPAPTIAPTDTPVPVATEQSSDNSAGAPGVVPTLVPDSTIPPEGAEGTGTPTEGETPEATETAAEGTKAPNATQGVSVTRKPAETEKAAATGAPAEPTDTPAPASVPANPMSRSGAEEVAPNSASFQPGITQEPEALLPLSGVKIGIDPGHQEKGNSSQEPVAPGSSQTKAKVSSGTQGIVTRVPEYVVVLDVSLQLRDALEALGAEVYLTRESHQVDISNIERAQMMNELGVDLVLRIHCNGSSDSSVHGISLFVKSKGPGAEESYTACEALLPAMAEATGARAMGIYKSDAYSGMNWSEVPSILVEMGFMSNEAEDRLLNDPDYQVKLVEGMVQGVADYMGRDLTAMPEETASQTPAPTGGDGDTSVGE